MKMLKGWKRERQEEAWMGGMKDRRQMQGGIKV